MYEIKFHKDSIELEFNRVITKDFAEWLRESDNKHVRVGVPMFGMLLGTVEATVVPDPKGKETVSAMYSYILDSKYKNYFERFSSEDTFIASNVIRGELVVYRARKLELIQPTRFEIFSPIPEHPINKQSPSWDHKQTVQELLFSREKVFLNVDNKSHWSDMVEAGIAILIPTDEPDETGLRHYTELTLGEDGWHYSSDLSSRDEYPELPVDEACKFVNAVMCTKAHQP